MLVNGDNPNSLNSYKKSLFQEYLQLNKECQNKSQDTFFDFLHLKPLLIKNSVKTLFYIILFLQFKSN